MRAAGTATLLMVLALLGACGGQDIDESGDSPSRSAPSTGEDPTAPAPDQPSPSGDPDTEGTPAKSPTCAEVRAGIDDFNAGDFEGTVDHFEKAVPLAESAAAAAGSDDQQAADLLEAVRYYADLAPEDYLDASASSPLFAKYTQITLGQCQPVPSAPDDDDGGPTVEA